MKVWKLIIFKLREVIIHSLAESMGSEFLARNCRMENPRDGHVIHVADMSSICITTLRRRSQLIDRRRLCTRGWRARPQQTGKPTTAIIAAYHFRFERKLSEEERALRHARLASEHVESLETQWTRCAWRFESNRVLREIARREHAFVEQIQNPILER